jgi:hypothetical protein
LIDSQVVHPAGTGGEPLPDPTLATPVPWQGAAGEFLSSADDSKLGDDRRGGNEPLPEEAKRCIFDFQ